MPFFHSDHSSKKPLTSFSRTDSLPTHNSPSQTRDRSSLSPILPPITEPTRTESMDTNPDSSAPEPPQVFQGLTKKLPPTITRYIAMLLSLDDISTLYNIVAAISTWLILAAFLVIPGTFTTFKDSQAFQSADDGSKGGIAHQILKSVAHIGLLWVSGIFCIIGGLGCLLVWIRWRQNYVWLVNKVFIPGLLNSFAGLLTVIINVYTAQHGAWSVTAKITAIVSGASVGLFGGLFILYTLFLDKVRSKHVRVMDAAYRSRYEKVGGAFGRVNPVAVFRRAGSSRDGVMRTLS